ncbi:pyruvate ferredoxin oxidoreductase [candidate division WOR-3 bacterium]|nr:pyruvate ferredoxin oxidoreductase [candidate division WOR-3 bacterium]
MSKQKVMMGNHALSYGAVVSKVNVISAYPITPQTQVVELLSELCSNGALDSEFIKVESEHSAMAACIGASAVGARTFTATSAQGLALMHEMLHWAVGARTPVVMGNINRSMGPPWTIWTEQTDSLSQRDTGWLQIYASSNQEVYDSVPIAFKIGEHKKVQLPVMVILDAFFLSHTSENVMMMDLDKAETYLPKYKPVHKLDVNEPYTFGALTTPEWYYELRYKIQKAHEDAIKVIEEAQAEFKDIFGREYGLVEEYKTADADTILVAISTAASTAKDTVDELREKGVKAGLLRLRFVRPFPFKKVREVLSSAKKILVLDRNLSPGIGGIIFQEIKSAMYNESNKAPIYGFIAGLGGRDITTETIHNIFEQAEKQDPQDIIWMEVKA